MKKVLITGATGNVGLAVLRSLYKSDHQLNIIAGVKNIEKNEETLMRYPMSKIRFDFNEKATFETAFENCDVLFLLRPPQISDVEKYFKPLLTAAKQKGIEHIVFLSVQGAEKSKFIPHHKIEKLIVESKIPYTFLRPAYFMQNFTTTLRSDLVFKKRIFLPAGNAKFTLVDVNDIGNVAALIISNTTKHRNVCYELTCNEKLTFKEMAAKLSIGLGVNIKYTAPSLFQFYRAKRKEGIARPLIFVMMMLHYLPRFQREPKITQSIKNITGNEPITFEAFIHNNKNLLTQ